MQVIELWNEHLCSHTPREEQNIVNIPQRHPGHLIPFPTHFSTPNINTLLIYMVVALLHFLNILPPLYYF